MNMLDKHLTRQYFEGAADSYDASAILQQEIAKRLGQRLDYIKLQPQNALDIGCGTGYLTKDLLKRYPKANIIALDIATQMLHKTKALGGWFRKPQRVCADAELLPFKENSVDLIVSNLMLPWCNDLQKTFIGFENVLAPNGLLLFSTFGPDTLKELRECEEACGIESSTIDFADMHEIGDTLLKAGFINPVTDMEGITMTYANVDQLMNDILKTGVISNNSNHSIDLSKKEIFEKTYEQFKTTEGLYPATWEIIYGHAWVGEGIKYENFEHIIPINAIL